MGPAGGVGMAMAEWWLHGLLSSSSDNLEPKGERFPPPAAGPLVFMTDCDGIFLTFSFLQTLNFLFF